MPPYLINLNDESEEMVTFQTPKTTATIAAIFYKLLGQLQGPNFKPNFPIPVMQGMYSKLQLRESQQRNPEILIKAMIQTNNFLIVTNKNLLAEIKTLRETFAKFPAAPDNTEMEIFQNEFEKVRLNFIFFCSNKFKYI